MRTKLPDRLNEKSGVSAIYLVSGMSPQKFGIYVLVFCMFSERVRTYFLAVSTDIG